MVPKFEDGKADDKKGNEDHADTNRTIIQIDKLNNQVTNRTSIRQSQKVTLKYK